jgi:signal transduction histidine kinase
MSAHAGALPKKIYFHRNAILCIIKRKAYNITLTTVTALLLSCQATKYFVIQKGAPIVDKVSSTNEMEKRIRCRRIKRAWMWLTEPPQSIELPALRRRSRLLSIIILAILLIDVLMAASTPLQLLYTKSQQMRFMLAVSFPIMYAVLTAFFLGAYVLCRMGRYKISAIMVVSIATCIGYSILFVVKESSHIVYPIVGVVLSSILLSRYTTIALFSAILVGTGILPVISKDFTFDDVTGALIIMVGIGILSSIAAVIHDRDLDQIEKQTDTIRQNQEKLLEAKKMEAVARLSAGIAHEFNNIITGIIGYSEIIANQADETIKTNAKIIKEAGMRAGRLTEHLLSFSRQQLLRPQETDLNHIITHLDHMLRNTMSDTITLTLALDPELSRVYVDPSQIEQIIHSLVTKAQKNVAMGGNITIKTENIAIESRNLDMDLQPGNYCLLSISDSGPTMDSEIISRIFEPFFTTGDFGTGDLEMAAAYGFVRQSDGHISIESDPQKGNILQIFLPQFEEATA